MKKRYWALLLVGGAASMVTMLLVGGQMGMGVGQGISRWRRARQPMSVLVDKAVSVTSKSLPIDLGAGWTFARIEGSPAGLTNTLTFNGAASAARFDAAVALMAPAMSTNLCAHEFTAAILTKGGTVTMRFEADVDGAPAHRIEILDAARCGLSSS